jgi:hypothetical protein
MKPPTAKQMRDFAECFTSEDWAYFCCHQEFLKVVTEDLYEARKLASLLMHELESQDPIV